MVAGVDVFQAMAEVGMPLLIHGEVTTAGVDIFDKEARFIEEVIKVSDCGARRSSWLIRRRHWRPVPAAVDDAFEVDPK